jgi:hypothetical protein
MVLVYAYDALGIVAIIFGEPGGPIHVLELAPDVGEGWGQGGVRPEWHYRLRCNDLGRWGSTEENLVGAQLRRGNRWAAGGKSGVGGA